MSAKKSASNIRPQDRKEFDAKLQAVHTELLDLDERCAHTLTWTLGYRACWTSISNYEDMRGIGNLRRCENLVIKGGFHQYPDDPDEIQHVLLWDKVTSQWCTTFWGTGARKWIQDYYTDGQKRAIGELIH